MEATRLFSRHHIWLEAEGGMARIGISDYAQEKLGDVMFVNLPEVGERLEIGKRFGDMESIKTISDLISPVAGEVIRVNEGLLDEPEEINEHSYESWLIEVKVFQLAGDLVEEATYLNSKDDD